MVATVPERKRLLADLRPLQESPEYRRLWAGQSLSAIGTQMTTVAVPVQVYAMTHSSLAVGALGLAVVPLIAVGVMGGSLADALDRRKLVLFTSSGLAVLSALFALQAALNLRQLWLLYLVTGLQAALFALDQPARTTFTPRLLPPNRIAAGTALSQLSFQLSGTAGPLLAGVVIAVAGLKTAYLIDAATFIFAVYAVVRLRPMPPEGGGTRPGFAAVAEGLRWVRHQPVIAMTFVVDLNAMIFGMPRALFPALAATHFGGGSRAVGLLYSAPAIGGFIGATFSGPLTRGASAGARRDRGHHGVGRVDRRVRVEPVVVPRRRLARGCWRGRHGERRLPADDPAAVGARCVARPVEFGQLRGGGRRPAGRRHRVRRSGCGDKSGGECRQWWARLPGRRRRSRTGSSGTSSLSPDARRDRANIAAKTIPAA